jgi:hypothetical protein
MGLKVKEIKIKVREIKMKLRKTIWESCWKERKMVGKVV